MVTGDFLGGTSTEAPPRWNRFFQQLADPKTALQPFTEMHLPMFKNKECRCRSRPLAPQFQCCWKQPQQSHDPNRKAPPTSEKPIHVHNTEIRRGAGRPVIQSDLHYHVCPSLLEHCYNRYPIGPSARISPKPANFNLLGMKLMRMGLHAYGSDGWAKCGNDWITTSNPNATYLGLEPQSPRGLRTKTGLH